MQPSACSFSCPVSSINIHATGQNSPKELAALRTTRSLHSLGRAAIFSNNPYVDTAIETLVPQEGLGPSSPASLAAMYAMMPRSAPSSLAGVMGRPSFGRMPKRSSKYAAMQRAKRTLSAGVPFLSEVPFADAVSDVLRDPLVPLLKGEHSKAPTRQPTMYRCACATLRATSRPCRRCFRRISSASPP